MSIVGSLGNILIVTTLLALGAPVSAAQIDRHALVARHNIAIDKFDSLSPLSVGNGGFAFTADVTGLQTFPEAYETGMPLTTLSEWGWHSNVNHGGTVC